MVLQDVLIVGRGIAGNTLALTLLEQGASIKVVDSPNPRASSRIAAGIFNPFTGKRTTKTWLADDLFPFLRQFYTRIEEETGVSFFYEKPIYRPFLSLEDYNDWSAKTGENEYDYFINHEPSHKHYSPWIRNTLGGIECKQSGFVDTIAYLDASKKLLEAASCLIEKDFEYQDLQIEQDKVIWNGASYRYVVFCEGVKAMHNPYFRNFPLAPNKGEILTLSIPGYPLQEIISKGVFLLPKKTGEFQLGSTYRWAFEHDEPERAGAEELIAKFSKWFIPAFQEVKLESGIRPATRDRRPLLGFLDKNPALLIFNGLGTKGVSLAPYWANELAQFILHQKELDPEVDIRRFYVN